VKERWKNIMMEFAKLGVTLITRYN